jgi:hypothetical protein
MKTITIGGIKYKELVVRVDLPTKQNYEYGEARIRLLSVDGYMGDSIVMTAQANNMTVQRRHSGADESFQPIYPAFDYGDDAFGTFYGLNFVSMDTPVDSHRFLSNAKKYTAFAKWFDRNLEKYNISHVTKDRAGQLVELFHKLGFLVTIERQIRGCDIPDNRLDIKWHQSAEFARELYEKLALERAKKVREEAAREEETVGADATL